MYPVDRTARVFEILSIGQQEFIKTLHIEQERFEILSIGHIGILKSFTPDKSDLLKPLISDT
jgi:hypothetical protein